MLCNRLEQILPCIISKNQSAFVASRTIVQNILICQDLVRLYNRKSTTKSCLIKIDLRKAYYYVKWAFVEEMLHALNFPTRFIKWIMACISTPQYIVTINGGMYEKIIGKKGASTRGSCITFAVSNMHGISNKNIQAGYTTRGV